MIQLYCLIYFLPKRMKSNQMRENHWFTATPTIYDPSLFKVCSWRCVTSIYTMLRNIGSLWMQGTPMMFSCGSMLHAPEISNFSLPGKPLTLWSVSVFIEFTLVQRKSLAGVSSISWICGWVLLNVYCKFFLFLFYDTCMSKIYYTLDLKTYW